MILQAAPPHLRCWLLLCSDLAIRSGTAAKITPENYDAATGNLTFTTKYGSKMTLPVTHELRVIFAGREFEQNVPYVAQLPRGAYTTHHGVTRELKPLGRMIQASLQHEFARLRRRLGITRKLTAHDFRRTTAVAIYEQTHDLRKVQAALGHAELNSTAWYLDHNLTPVALADLELAKLNPTTEAIQ